MLLTREETANVLLAADAEELGELLSRAADQSWDGKEPLSDHYECLFKALNEYDEPARARLSTLQLQLSSAEDGRVRCEFCGELSDEALNEVTAAGDCTFFDDLSALTGGVDYFYKPVIYLYPEAETDVTVRVSQENMAFTCVYPACDLPDGWSVTARPDGTLSAGGRSYNYLYWEGREKTKWADTSRGFCVPGKETAAFLEDALARLGLRGREANEFIVYWLPRMQENPWNLISFQGENYERAVPLTVQPAPDTVIRVYMVWKPLNAPCEIEPQELTAPERRGFTVVEWGGSCAAAGTLHLE